MYQLDKAQAIVTARMLFHQAYQRGQFGRILTWLTRRSYRLYELATIQHTCVLAEHHDTGKQTVLIRQIRGTGSRVRDFDLDFYPLQASDEERWQGVAAAWITGKKLPPVRLVQVEDTYFVQDGHHRISIARMLGKTHIEALVTTWQVGERLPGIQRPPHSACRIGSK